ncbi:DUF3192 domain-containing protein [Pseudoalteromonas sp. MMG010]|uniref:DUF3192 domain-containing protein n=1 Tax=Pseudoalteromonas sp. MMG010 TaxID=2822685 RepID=UPI001B3A19B3|nr:DUF3192 domain-containing protein [Pseudoalteromonas sp. MMG010]MBQ4832871.1 DUF3192 domain-containing protein [Pseudoalteromonas sp. MMG010]
MKKLLLIAALSTVFLNGCVIAVSDGEAETHWATGKHDSWQEHHKFNREAIANLPLKYQYQDVLAQLKTPDFTDLLLKDGNTYQVLYYATNSIHSDGKTSKDECTPLVFKNNELIGVGDIALKALVD